MTRLHYIADDLGVSRTYVYLSGDEPPVTDAWAEAYVDDGVAQVEELLHAHAEFERRYPEEGAEA